MKVLSALGRWVDVPDPHEIVNQADWYPIAEHKEGPFRTRLAAVRKEGVNTSDLCFSVRSMKSSDFPSLEVLIEDDGKVTAFITEDGIEKIVPVGNLDLVRVTRTVEHDD